MSNEQIAFSPNLYIDGFSTASLEDKSIVYSSGVCRDSANVMDLSVVAGSFDATRPNGIGGLDTGALVASTWYYVYAIGSSNNLVDSGIILSTSKNGPLMPLGTDSYRLIDVLRTDGFINFLSRRVSGTHTYRDYVWDEMITVLTAGAATTLTAVDLSTAVPSFEDAPVNLMVSFTPGADGSKASITSFGSTATNIPFVAGPFSARVFGDLMRITSSLNGGLPEVQYINSAASGATTIQVYGFELSL